MAYGEGGKNKKRKSYVNGRERESERESDGLWDCGNDNELVSKKGEMMMMMIKKMFESGGSIMNKRDIFYSCSKRSRACLKIIYSFVLFLLIKE